MTDLVAYVPYYNFLWLIDDDLYFNLSLWFFKIFFESKGIFDKAGVTTFFPPRIPAKAPERSGAGLSSNGALLLED